MSKLTQQQFAAQLGLSYRTVSRVFNGDASVKEGTRQRVLSEAERVGFRGHSLARALRLKRSFAIGVIAVHSPHSFWTEVLLALEQRARESGYHVIFCHRETGAGAAAELRFLLDRQVDAIVLAPHPAHEDLTALLEVEESGKPLLLLNTRLDGYPAHYLGTDSRTGSRKACEYLLRLGHRRIAFCAGPARDYTADCRLAGYRNAMRAAGLADGEQTVIPCGWLQSDGEAAAREILALPQRPTAITCVNDDAAIGVYLQLREAGVSVPGEISLIGYSGERVGELLAVPLTTVAQPTQQLGRRAAELVLESIAGRHLAPVREELADEVLVRASCAPLTA